MRVFISARFFSPFNFRFFLFLNFLACLESEKRGYEIIVDARFIMRFFYSFIFRFADIFQIDNLIRFTYENDSEGSIPSTRRMISRYLELDP